MTVRGEIGEGGRLLFLHITKVTTYVSILTLDDCFIFSLVSFCRRDSYCDLTNVSRPSDDGSVRLVLSRKHGLIVSKGRDELRCGRNNGVTVDSKGARLSRRGRANCGRLVIPSKGHSFVAFSSNAQMTMGTGAHVMCPSRFSKRGQRVCIGKRICLRMSPSGGRPFIIGAGHVRMRILNARFGMDTCSFAGGRSIILMSNGMRISACGCPGGILGPGSVLACSKRSSKLQMGAMSISRCVD